MKTTTINNTKFWLAVLGFALFIAASLLYAKPKEQPEQPALQAANLCVNIPTNDQARVQEALGNLYLTPPHTANLQELQAIVQQWIITRTRDYEKYKAAAQYSPTPLEMVSPTPTATATFTPTPTETPTP